MAFKIGEIVLIDPQNKFNLATYDPMFGRIVRKVRVNTYDVDILQYDNTTGEYKSYDDSIVELTTDHLGKLNDSGVIIRTPVSHPIINKKDLAAMMNIISLYDKGEKPRYEDIMRLGILYEKIIHFRNIFGGEDDES